MSRAGDCYDNAVAESFFASLKKECLSRVHFATYTEAFDGRPGLSPGTSHLAEVSRCRARSARPSGHRSRREKPLFQHPASLLPFVLSVGKSVALARIGPVSFPTEGGGANSQAKLGRDRQNLAGVRAVFRRAHPKISSLRIRSRRLSP